jgi:FdhD protein
MTDFCPSSGITPHFITTYRWDNEQLQSHQTQDLIAKEEPLQIRIEGQPFATLMRTPGHDADLITGFLITEKIISSPKDILELSFCPSLTNPDTQSVADILLTHPDKLPKPQNRLTSTSSCGICGKEMIETHLTHTHPTLPLPHISPQHLTTLPDLMRKQQGDFTKTGAIHACAYFDEKHQLIALREDVGRHNALDKLIGHLHTTLNPYPTHLMGILLLSGRVSFEMMQKAHLAGFTTIAAISAPTSLAIDFARQANMRLIGFLRPPTWNLYHDPSH